MNNEKGISLISLIIIVVVLVVFVVILLLIIAYNNPIEKSSEAQFKKNVEEYKSELLIAISNQYFSNHSFKPEQFNATTWDGNKENIGDSIKKYITNISVLDGKKFEIQKATLVYVGEDNEEMLWLKEVGCLCKYEIIQEKDKKEVSVYEETEINDETEDIEK